MTSIRSRSSRVRLEASAPRHDDLEEPGDASRSADPLLAWRLSDEQLPMPADDEPPKEGRDAPLCRSAAGCLATPIIEARRGSRRESRVSSCWHPASSGRSVHGLSMSEVTTSRAAALLRWLERRGGSDRVGGADEAHSGLSRPIRSVGSASERSEFRDWRESCCADWWWTIASTYDEAPHGAVRRL